MSFTLCLFSVAMFGKGLQIQRHTSSCSTSQFRLYSAPAYSSGTPVVRCGDSTLAATYLSLGGSKSADVVVTDPPYCLLERRRTGQTVAISLSVALANFR
jgi:hypothetical protein